MKKTRRRGSLLIMAVTIRAYQEPDIESIYNIHVGCIKDICSSCYNDEVIKDWVERQSTERYLTYFKEGNVLVAERENKVIGFGHISITDQEDCDHEIKSLYVSPNVIGQGIGTLLMKELESIALRQNCTKLLVYSSANAVTFYKRFGFTDGQCAMKCPNHGDTALFCIRMIKIF